MRRILTIILCVFGFFHLGLSQTQRDTVPNNNKYRVDQERYVSILTGYNFWQNHYGELGIAIHQYGRIGHHPTAWAYFISSEIKLGDKMVVGPKIGAWIAGGSAGVCMGLNVIYYTDFEESTLRFRPEIGMGLGKWKVVYGYNIPITNKKYELVNTHTIGIAVVFGAKKIKTIHSE